MRGHLKGYRNVGEFKSWTKRDPREIITDPRAISKEVLPGQGGLRDLLRALGRACDRCVVGTDADLEGCNIGLIDALPEVKRGNPFVEVRQLWLSALDPKSVREGFGKLVPPR